MWEIQKGEGWSHRGGWTDSILDTGKDRKKKTTGVGGTERKQRETKNENILNNGAGEIVLSWRGVFCASMRLRLQHPGPMSKGEAEGDGVLEPQC